MQRLGIVGFVSLCLLLMSASAMAHGINEHPSLSAAVICSPGDKRCENNMVMRCGQWGDEWFIEQNCGAFQCLLGECKGIPDPPDPDEESDGDLPPMPVDGDFLPDGDDGERAPTMPIKVDEDDDDDDDGDQVEIEEDEPDGCRASGLPGIFLVVCLLALMFERRFSQL